MSNENTATPAETEGQAPKGSVPRNCEAAIRGNVGTLPVKRKTQSGVEMTQIRLAVNMAASSVPPEERSDFTEWYSVLAFAPAQQERLARIEKGELITVNGPVTLHSYNTENGPRTERTIVAEWIRSASASIPPDAGAPAGTKSDVPPGK